MKILKLAGVILAAGIMLSLAACGLTPQTTFQGRLTDASGIPLNGAATITYSLFKTETGGTAIYTQSNSVTLNQGLFSSVVGPATLLANLKPEDLAEPLYLEIRVQHGGITETLTPRQRLYGSPYAFTLLPGAVISSTFSTSVQGAYDVKAITSIYNSNTGSVSDPALPALFLSGDTALELESPTGWGYLRSAHGSTYTDIGIISNDDMILGISDKYPYGSFLYLMANRDAADQHFCYMNNAADWICQGTKSAVVDVGGEQRLLYAIESPQVWFEDFGSASLLNGAVTVTIDPIFAQTVTLGAGYHVFLTPLGDCKGLYVASKTPTGFEVRELGGGLANVMFDYRIIAHRLGYETQRLDLQPVEATDKLQVEAQP